MKDRLSGKSILLLYGIAFLIIVPCFLKFANTVEALIEVQQSRYQEMEELLNE